MIRQAAQLTTAGLSSSDLAGIIIGAALLLAIWFLVAAVGHGYANTVDTVAFWLHRHATDTRNRHLRRHKTVSEGWIRQIEGEG